MAGGTIHVDEAALADLRDALTTAGEDYKSELARLPPPIMMPRNKTRSKSDKSQQDITKA